MSWYEILLAIEIPHNLVGMTISCCFDCDGFEFVNPSWIYQNYQVNRFGSVFISIIYSLYCPIGTIIYWIYKLCTIGRR